MKLQQISVNTKKQIEQLSKLRNDFGLLPKQIIALTKTPKKAIIEEESIVEFNLNERQINTWDLVDVNYLQKGAIVARSVCKLHARDMKGPYVGTGFMVSNRLLVTNYHNLPSKEIAKNAFVEFDHELGPDGFPKIQQRFIIKPDEAFWSDKSLDICIVACSEKSQAGISLSDYGYLNLDPEVGKIKKGNFISLIHHPNGELKQVSIRENQLIKKEDEILLYASDTATGSSGAPCFSDKWQVVAIHRRGVPQTKEGDENLIALKNGAFMTKEEINDLRILESDILWLANEGVRVSVFIKKLKNNNEAIKNELISSWLADLGSMNFKDSSLNIIPSGNSGIPIFIENRRADKDYEKRNGYQSDFLGIDLPKPSLEKATEKWGRTSYNSDTGKAEFSYYNYSLWMSRERRMAFVTAVNIDGKNHNQRNRDEFGNDKWEYDDRLPERLQIGNWFYGSEPTRYNKNYFDRGHIVRRTEPTWGPNINAQLANDDTFHWTNCSPQYKDFNQRSKYWQGLEIYLLDNGAIEHEKKMTIFAGPIFSGNDVEHRGVLIPKEFFKIAAFMDGNNKLVSSGYVLDQSEWVDIIDFEKAYKLDVFSVRRSVKWIEEKTGINFGVQIREADAAKNLGNDFTAISKLPDIFLD